MITCRSRLGALVLDWPRFAWHVGGSCLRNGRGGWIGVRNRHETGDTGPGGIGYDVSGEDTSELHVASVLPVCGRQLLKVALRDAPILFDDAPETYHHPIVSFVIPHRGEARLPLLLATLRSLAGQRDVPCECVVVEQSHVIEIRDQLPGWVRHLHQPWPRGRPFSRAAALNLGAQHAKGEMLILHDGDMCVPSGYADEVRRRVAEGFECVQLKRFVFCLSDRDTERLVSAGRFVGPRDPVRVVANLEAGGSLGISRDAYDQIGGMDESFVGWGGEDNELWDRCRTLRCWRWGYLPILHLWHAAQPEKGDVHRATASLLDERRRVAVPQRIEALRAAQKGAVPVVNALPDHGAGSGEET